MGKACPRCNLPQKGVNVCEYCGLIFAKFKKPTFKEKLAQKNTLTSVSTLNSSIVDQIKQFFLIKSKQIRM